MLLLEGKNIVITGARRGIGRATVEACATQGANIWACARRPDINFEAEMNDLSVEHDVHIWPVYFDLSDMEQVRNAVQIIRKQKINVDVLINVAGIAEDSTSFPMTSIEKMRKVMEINYFAPTILTQYISRIMMKQKRGNIINVASIAGIDGIPAQYEYASSKAALIGGTKNLANELAQYNIRVNAIAPGVIETDMGRQIEDDLRKKMLSRIIMNRLGTAKEVADVIVFLSSEMASYITGQVIRVDGGI